MSVPKAYIFILNYVTYAYILPQSIYHFKCYKKNIRNIGKTKQLSPNTNACFLESYLSFHFELGSYVPSSNTASASSNFDFICEENKENNGSVSQRLLWSVSE